MRREIFKVIQKNASWMSEEELIELSRNIGEVLEASQKKQVEAATIEEQPPTREYYTGKGRSMRRML
jgi:hypothetical protein